MAHRPAITDAYGRTIELYTLFSDEARLDERCALPEDRLARLDQRVKELIPPKGAGAGLAEVIATMVVAVVVAVVFGLLRLSPGWGIAALWIGGISVYGVSGSLRCRRLHARHGPRIVEAFLAERCCPHCGYDLEGATPGEDGCTICPECSAAWRMPAAGAVPIKTKPVRHRPVTDHRGRPITLCDLWRDRPDREGGEAVPFKVQQRIRARLKRRLDLMNAASLVTIVALPLAIVLPPWFTVWSGMHKATAQLIFVGVLVVVSAVVALARRWFTYRRHGPAVIGAFLAERRCPACGHDLAATPRDTEGLTVCPECAAAWKIVLSA